MKLIYRFYQLIVALPIGLFVTFVITIATMVFCMLGCNALASRLDRFWGWFLVRLFFLPVTVEGRENLVRGQSYVYCPNHQGAYDIFLVYGFLHRDFRWVMKESLRKIPFVGKACEAAGFVFIDNRSPSSIRKSMEQARDILKKGVSVTVFPEGRRTMTGEMGPYKRGAFMLADELQMPVVPITIDGSFDVLPRYRGFNFLTWHPMRLVIHKPLFPIGKGPENIAYLMEESRKATASALHKE